MRTTHPEVPWPPPSTVMNPADASFFREMWPHRVRPKEAWSVRKGQANVWRKPASARKLKPRSEAGPRADAPWRYTIHPGDEAPYARRPWTSAVVRDPFGTCSSNSDADCRRSNYSPLRDVNSSRVWGSSKSPVVVPYGNIAGVRSGLYQNPPRASSSTPWTRDDQAWPLPQDSSSPRAIGARVPSGWNGDDVCEMCGSAFRAFATSCERRASATPPVSALSAAGTTIQEHSEPPLRDCIRPQTAPPHHRQPDAGFQAHAQHQPAAEQERELKVALTRVQELEEELSITKRSASVRVKALQGELSNCARVIDDLQKELKMVQAQRDKLLASALSSRRRGLLDWSRLRRQHTSSAS